jgi:hypothetical protein
MYADDVKIYYVIRDPLDRITLQRCLDRVYEWAQKWELKFSFEKCQLLQIGYKNVNISYNLGTHTINSSESIVDLGVTVQPSLKPSFHCLKIATKANIRAKLILKCFLSRNSVNFIRAFKCYVRPVLEYACVVWNPSLIQDINLIENVQRSFTRKVCILCNIPVISYDERLTLFGLERLELRRLKFELIELFKIVHGYTTCCIYDVLQFGHHNATHITRGHRYKLTVMRTCKNTFKYYFLNRITNVWNSLPNDYFNTVLISSFKAKLSHVDFSNFMCGRL